MAAPGVHHDGFMGVTAQRLDGLGVAARAAVRGVDLEDIAVVLGHAVLAGPVLGLLTGQPGAPRGVAARAVGGGAGEPHPLGDLVAAHLDDRAAAGRGGVVDEALGERDGVLPAGSRALQLVVVDEQGRAARTGEGGGAVMVGRGELPGLQPGPPAVRDDPVREPGGQRENAVRIEEQRPVADPAVPGGRLLPDGAGLRGREGLGRGGEGADAARQRDPGPGERGLSGEVPAAERHGVSPVRVGVP